MRFDTASPRVLVASSSVGHGHMMAARALADALRARHPMLDVAQVDTVERVAFWHGRLYRWLYVTLVDQAPLLWRVVYTATDRHSTALGHALTMLGGRGFVQACRRWRPHVILCTHFLAAEVLSRTLRRGGLATSLQMVIPDWDVHRSWYWPEVRRYFVASELVKARLALRFGVPEERILVTGIPVRRGFARRHDLVDVRGRYGLDPGRPTVLFLSGGFASGPMRQSILGLWMERRDIQVIAVCGGNARLRRRVESLPRPPGAVLHALGFVEDPAPLLAVADLVVAKSGGMTCSECLAAGKPLVISASIPGQEERNADAMVEAGAAVRAPTPEEIRWRVTRLLEDPVRLEVMRRAARRMARPQAADVIVDAVAEDLRQPQVARPRFHGAT